MSDLHAPAAAPGDPGAALRIGLHAKLRRDLRRRPSGAEGQWLVGEGQDFRRSRSLDELASLPARHEQRSHSHSFAALRRAPTTD